MPRCNECGEKAEEELSIPEYSICFKCYWTTDDSEDDYFDCNAEQPDS
jgi:hypothetical protein